MPPSLRSVVILAGTNDIEANCPWAVCAGVRELIRRIQGERTGLSVGVLAVLPRKPGPYASGLTETELMFHLNSRGYGVMTAAIVRLIQRLQHI